MGLTGRELEYLSLLPAAQNLAVMTGTAAAVLHHEVTNTTMEMAAE